MSSRWDSMMVNEFATWNNAPSFRAGIRLIIFQNFCRRDANTFKKTTYQHAVPLGLNDDQRICYPEQRSFISRRNQIDHLSKISAGAMLNTFKKQSPSDVLSGLISMTQSYANLVLEIFALSSASRQVPLDGVEPFRNRSSSPIYILANGAIHQAPSTFDIPCSIFAFRISRSQNTTG